MRIALVAGEESGDQLGAKLMRAIKRQDIDAQFIGVGGSAMTAEGLSSVFPMADIAVMGFVPVIARLPTLLARIRTAAAAILADAPDVLVIIDSPDFTHRVARRVRRARPALPVVDYVSPTVWAWRPGRARRMRAYVDEVLALLPFEPGAHRRLGGPACTYIGHPLIERLGDLRPDAAETRARATAPPLVLVMPGSRRSEIVRLLPVFGDALARLAAVAGPLEAVLPAVPHLAREIGVQIADWPVRPELIVGEAAKYAAFRRARVALAASGTATLELALSGVPMVGAYRAGAVEAALARRIITAPSVLLPNLVLETRVVPEFLQEECTAERLAEAVTPLLRDGPEREAQVQAFTRLDALMSIGDDTPSARAARIVREWAKGIRTRP